MSKRGKVFLGGTRNGYDWRTPLIEMLECDYFNPVVEDWTEESRQEEQRQKTDSDLELYVITADHKGAYSAAEVMEAALKRPANTMLALLAGDGFAPNWNKLDGSPITPWVAVAERVRAAGGAVVTTKGMMLGGIAIMYAIANAVNDHIGGEEAESHGVGNITIRVEREESMPLSELMDLTDGEIVVTQSYGYWHVDIPSIVILEDGEYRPSGDLAGSCDTPVGAALCMCSELSNIDVVVKRGCGRHHISTNRITLDSDLRAQLEGIE